MEVTTGQTVPKFRVWLGKSRSWAGEEILPPAQEFGKRSDVFRILMPTAPTRENLLPRY